MRRGCRACTQLLLAHRRRRNAHGASAAAEAAAATASLDGCLYGVPGLREPQHFARLAQEAVARRVFLALRLGCGALTSGCVRAGSRAS